MVNFTYIVHFISKIYTELTLSSDVPRFMRGIQRFSFYMLLTDQLQLFYALFKELEKEGAGEIKENSQAEKIADLWATLNNSLISADMPSKQTTSFHPLCQDSCRL